MNSMRSLLLPAEDHLTQMGSRFALRTHGASATTLSGAACFPSEGDILLPPTKASPRWPSTARSHLIATIRRFSVGQPGELLVCY